MKTQTIARMLRRRFMTNRCELTVRCSAEMFTRIVVPMRLYHTIGSVRSVEHRRGVLRVLVKVFDDDHERTHLTARALRRLAALLVEMADGARQFVELEGMGAVRLRLHARREGRV